MAEVPAVAPVASGGRSRRARAITAQRRDRLHGKSLDRATRSTGKVGAFLDLSRTRGQQSPEWRPNRVGIAEGPAGARRAGVAERSTSGLALPAMPLNLGDPASATSAVVTATYPPRTTRWESGLALSIRAGQPARISNRRRRRRPLHDGPLGPAHLASVEIDVGLAHRVYGPDGVPHVVARRAAAPCLAVPQVVLLEECLDA